MERKRLLVERKSKKGRAKEAREEEYWREEDKVDMKRWDGGKEEKLRQPKQKQIDFKFLSFCKILRDVVNARL